MNKQILIKTAKAEIRKGLALGTGVGALLGGGISYLKHRKDEDKKDRWKKILGGAGIGASIGLPAGGIGGGVVGLRRNLKGAREVLRTDPVLRGRLEETLRNAKKDLGNVQNEKGFAGLVGRFVEKRVDKQLKHLRNPK